MAELVAERTGRVGRPLGTVVVERVWRFFCSVRAAIYEIVFLALLVLIGTLKGSVIPAQIPRYVPVLEPLVERWYAFDVFHSLIFSLTLLLLAVAIVVCTLNRAPGIWRSIAQPTVPTTRHFFRTADPAVEVRSGEDAETVAKDLISILRQRRYRVLSEQRDGEIHVYADKHRFGKLGTFPFHLALILILVGGIVGSEFGFREPVFTIPEGSVRDVGRGTGLRIRLDRFVDTYSQLGVPTEFRSDLILYEGDREVRRQNITVNNPLTYRGVTFYQSAFGPAAALRVTDATGAVVFDDGLEFPWRSKTNADAPAGILDLPAQGIRFELVFPNVKLDAKPEIGNVKLIPGELYAQARDLATNEKIGEGVIIGQGETATVAGHSVQFVRERRFTLLQVAYNPGIPILFAASILLVLGLAITFYFPHRRVRALVGQAGAGAEILLAPLARRDWSGKRDFARTLDDVEARFGAAMPLGRTAHVGD
ncbi:MAG: cytochrome c biogenesis protein ResB [Chloroflexota bacterium]|nr:cytochrome c biogenesis protein ResB [Chloroflexota bacterium]